MELWQAILLGVVQGLTEFLPISSTAHLRIVPALAGWNDPGAAFSAVIQIGTLAAVFYYFRADIRRIIRAVLLSLVGRRDSTEPPVTPAKKMQADPPRGKAADARLGWMIAWGTLPIVICGLAFQKQIKAELRQLWVIVASLIALAVLLAVAELLTRRRQRIGRPLKDLAGVSWLDATIIGLAQAVALVPGSSRSGVTITGGLFCGLSRETAARFSFLLSLPSVLAAGVYELYKERHELLSSQANLMNLIAATVAAAIVGYAAIAFLMRYLKTHTTWIFIIYRIVLGLFLAAMLLAGRIPNVEPPHVSIQQDAVAMSAPADDRP